MHDLAQLFLLFCQFSLMAFGGANSVLPEMHRYLVDTYHWLSPAEFATLFAIAQAAPGPNVLIVTLIGFKLAGLPGAFVTTIGMCGPSSVLSFYVSKLWHRFDAAPGRKIIEKALAPITVGLILGSGWVVSQSACSGMTAWLICCASAVAAFYCRINPLWLLAAGALAGMMLF